MGTTADDVRVLDKLYFIGNWLPLSAVLVTAYEFLIMTYQHLMSNYVDGAGNRIRQLTKKNRSFEILPDVFDVFSHDSCQSHQETGNPSSPRWLSTQTTHPWTWIEKMESAPSLGSDPGIVPWSCHFLVDFYALDFHGLPVFLFNPRLTT